MWSGGVDPDDVAQGRLGNCYYLAAMAGCALGDDDILLKVLSHVVLQNLSREDTFNSRVEMLGRQIENTVSTLMHVGGGRVF
jgi:hypothetical protein